MAFPAEKHREIMICENDRKTIPAPFISKTYQLVDDPRSNHIVSWGEHDATFVVWRPPEFARDILPSYFKHNNFSSFVRQLNTYGFRKVVACRWEFANEFFKKGQKHLLCDVQRRKTASSDHQIYQSQCYSSLERRQRSSNDLEDSTWTNVNLPQTSQYNHDYNGYLLAALEDNQRLRKKNILLLSELTQMKKLYNDIVFYIQNCVNMNTNCRSREVGLSLVKISEEMEEENSIKVFGVELRGKKRLYHEDR